MRRRLLPVLVLLAGCATAGGFRETNLANLARLTPGMPRSEVISLMGTESVPVAGTESGFVGTSRDSLAVTSVQIPIGGPKPLLQNPHRSEIYSAGGREWEVLFYYTRLVANDGLVTDDELTPVVLRDGILVGTGWPFWSDQVAVYGIPAQLPRFEAPTAPEALRSRP